MHLLSRLLDGILRAAGTYTLLLQRFLLNLLAGLHAFSVAADATLESLTQYMSEMFYLTGQILLTLLRLTLILLPGLAPLVYGLLQGIPWLWLAGGAYVLLCLIAGIAYRDVGQRATQRTKLPANWLGYFPFSWSQDEHLAPALTRLLNAYSQLREAAKDCDRNNPFASDLRTIEFKMRRYLSRARTAIKRQARQIKLAKGQPAWQVSIAQSVEESAGKFEELSAWALAVARHEALSTDKAGLELTFSEEWSQQMDYLKTVATALDALTPENGRAFPLPPSRHAQAGPSTESSPERLRDLTEVSNRS